MVALNQASRVMLLQSDLDDLQKAVASDRRAELREQVGALSLFEQVLAYSRLHAVLDGPGSFNRGLFAFLAGE